LLAFCFLGLTLFRFLNRMFRPPPGAAAAMTRETVMLARLPLQQLQASAVQILRAIQLHKRAVAKSAESGHRGQQQM